MLSGGLDSVYNLYAAHEKWGEKLLALFYDYGQKALSQEKAAAKHFTDKLQIELQTIDISKVFTSDSSALTSEKKQIPTDQVDIESHQASLESAKKVWVSNRNGVFLNVAACVAESLGAQWIVPGFNAEEAATFPDNSVEYIKKMNSCLKMSTASGVQIHCFSQSMSKRQIVKACKNFSINFAKIWPCYHNGQEICGQCESCQRFLRAREESKCKANG